MSKMPARKTRSNKNLSEAPLPNPENSRQPRTTRSGRSASVDVSDAEPTLTTRSATGEQDQESSVEISERSTSRPSQKVGVKGKLNQKNRRETLPTLSEDVSARNSGQFKSPAVNSELSGTTNVAYHSDGDTIELDVEVMLDALPDLIRQSSKVLKTLSGDSGDIESSLRDLQEEDSTIAKRLSYNKRQLNIAMEPFGGNQYITTFNVLDAFLSAKDFGGLDLEKTNIDAVLRNANLTRFIQSFVGLGSEDPDTMSTLQANDAQFPEPFLSSSEFTLDSGESNDSLAAVLSSTFELGLDLRTQLLISVLSSSDPAAKEDPHDVLAQIFNVENNIRGWAFPGLYSKRKSQSSQAIIVSAKFKQQVLRRMERIRISFPPQSQARNSNGNIDVEDLRFRFPWTKFISQIVRWSVMQCGKLEKEIEESEGIQTIVESSGNISAIRERSAQPPAPAQLQKPPSILHNSSSILQKSPSIPQKSPSVPRASPSISRVSPSISRASPSISRASPSISRASPSISRASPSVPRASPSVPRARVSSMDPADTRPGRPRESFNTPDTIAYIKNREANLKRAEARKKEQLSTSNRTVQHSRRTPSHSSTQPAIHRRSVSRNTVNSAAPPRISNSPNAVSPAAPPRRSTSQISVSPAALPQRSLPPNAVSSSAPPRRLIPQTAASSTAPPRFTNDKIRGDAGYHALGRIDGDEDDEQPISGDFDAPFIDPYASSQVTKAYIEQEQQRGYEAVLSEKREANKEKSDQAGEPAHRLAKKRRLLDRQDNAVQVSFDDDEELLSQQPPSAQPPAGSSSGDSDSDSGDAFEVDSRSSEIRPSKISSYSSNQSRTISGALASQRSPSLLQNRSKPSAQGSTQTSRPDGYDIPTASQQAKLARAKSRPWQPPVPRRSFSTEEEIELIRLIEVFGCAWAKIEGVINDREYNPLRGRTQVNLKDKARNLKFTLLKAKPPGDPDPDYLPVNFDDVTLSKSQKNILQDMNIIFVGQTRAPRRGGS